MKAKFTFCKLVFLALMAMGSYAGCCALRRGWGTLPTSVIDFLGEFG